MKLNSQQHLSDHNEADVFVSNETSANGTPNKTVADDHLKIMSHSVTVHNSSMPEDMKSQRQANAPKLYELANDIMKKSSDVGCQATWDNEHELTLSGQSSKTLHSIVLKAEELGMNVTYTKSLTVTISK